MIVTELYRGQGFGNQLWLIAVTISAARKLKCDYSILSFHRFKGSKFLKIDPGTPLKHLPGRNSNATLPETIVNYITDDKLTVNNYEHFIKPFSKIDGNYQFEELILLDRDFLSELFTVSMETTPDLRNTCLINLRGGEYAGEPGLLLPSDYYKSAQKLMKIHNPNFDFKVVTDDLNLSQKYFPDLEVLSLPPRPIPFLQARFPFYKKIMHDFWLIQNAGGLILSNSSFSWWGAWTNKKCTKVIAPTFWGNFNNPKLGWAPSGVMARGWDYLDKNNNLTTK